MSSWSTPHAPPPHAGFASGSRGLKLQRCPAWGNKGKCKQGRRCPFAHGEHELAPKEVKQQIMRAQKEAIAQQQARHQAMMQPVTAAIDDVPVRQRDARDEVYMSSDDEAGAHRQRESPLAGGQSRSRSRSSSSRRCRSRSSRGSRSRSSSGRSRSRSRSPRRRRRYRYHMRSHSRSRSSRRRSSSSRSRSGSAAAPAAEPARPDQGLTHRMDGTPLDFSSRDAKREQKKQRLIEEIFDEQSAAWGISASDPTKAGDPFVASFQLVRAGPCKPAHNMLCGRRRAADLAPQAPGGRGREFVKPAWLAQQVRAGGSNGRAARGPAASVALAPLACAPPPVCRSAARAWTCRSGSSASARTARRRREIHACPVRRFRGCAVSPPLRTRV